MDIRKSAVLIGAIPTCLYKLLKIKISQKHINLLSICELATSFDLQSHYQAILNHISVGILSGSAHVWDPKNVYRIKTYSIKTVVYIK
jgi:hypothetical protein